MARRLLGLSVAGAAAFTGHVDPFPGYSMDYTTNATHIQLTITAQTSGWVGFGLAEAGGMIGADIMMAWALSSLLTQDLAVFLATAMAFKMRAFCMWRRGAALALISMPTKLHSVAT